MIKWATMKQVPITKELKSYVSMFYCHYIRSQNSNTPIAIIVVAKLPDGTVVRGSAVCSSVEKTFNAINGYTLAARRAIRAIKLKQSEPFSNGSSTDPNMVEFENLCNRIGILPDKYQFGCSLTNKEQKILNEVGFRKGDLETESTQQQVTA